MLNEIVELTSFIEAANLKKASSCDEARCLNFLTEKSHESFEQARADMIRAEYHKNYHFKDTINKLGSICLGKTDFCQNCFVRKYCNHYVNNIRKNKGDSNLKLIDLFCGAGGLSLGFTQEGFSIILANDIQDCCIKTYAHNHPELSKQKIVLGDIEEIVNNTGKYLHRETPDIVIGGPPCQGFSVANRQRLINDPRNKLYKSFIQMVNLTMPKFLVMENVKGMSKVKTQVIEDFNKIGYEVSARVLNAANFGIPQNRERLIYIGNKINLNNEIILDEIEEEGSKLPKTCLNDALFGLRELEASRVKNATTRNSIESGYLVEKNIKKETNQYINLINEGRHCSLICNHKARYNNDRDIEIFSRMNPGDKSDDPKIADIMPYKNRENIFRDKYYKLELNKICKTITAHMKYDCNMYIHPTQARGLTPREAARIQSYPDDYFFKGPYTKTYMQIGNSVPPLLSRTIARIIKRYLLIKN